MKTDRESIVHTVNSNIMTSSSQDRDYLDPLPNLTPDYIELTEGTDGYITPNTKRDDTVLPTDRDGYTYITPNTKRDDTVLPTVTDGYIKLTAKKDQTANTEEYRYMSLDGRESGIYDEVESYPEPIAHKQQPRRKIPTPDDQGILKADTPTGPRDYRDARSADPSSAHIAGDLYYNRSRERPIVEGNYTQTRSDDRFEGEYSYQALSRSGRSDIHVYSGVTNNRYRPTYEHPEYFSTVPEANADSNEENCISVRNYYRAKCIVGWFGTIIGVAILVTLVIYFLNSETLQQFLRRL